MFKSLVVFVSLMMSQYAWSQVGSAKAYVSLSPAGDFVANLKTTGGATVTGTKIEAKNIVIDLKTMTTGLDLRDDHAKNKYLEVSKYPTAIIVEATGENGKGQGKLKFHGKEGNVSGTYTIQNGKTVNAEFNIKLSDYGITEINYKGIGVEDSVKIQVQMPILAAAKPAVIPAAKKK